MSKTIRLKEQLSLLKIIRYIEFKNKAHMFCQHLNPYNLHSKLSFLKTIEHKTNHNNTSIKKPVNMIQTTTCTLAPSPKSTFSSDSKDKPSKS